jgi:hypothetical protein
VLVGAIIGGQGVLMSSGTLRHSIVLSLLLAAVLIAACGPVKAGPPNMADVEEHLTLTVGYVPEGCEPVGLDGDGRGKAFGAAFDCPEGATLRIERFDASSNDAALSASPSETDPGRVEWRDEPTGDVIRVASDDLDIGVLLQVAESIEVHA